MSERDSILSSLVRVNTPRKGILRWAVLSRCLVILISAVSNYIIPDHDATDVFVQPTEDETDCLHGCHFFDNCIKFLLGGLARWDAQYFLHIAKHGYVFENSLAFFPLFPLLTMLLSSMLDFFLNNILTKTSVLLLSATILNFAAFLKAADILYSISIFVLGDIRLAYISAILFCFNPASIFFSAPYSETIFCLLTFSGIYHTYKSDWDILSSIMFGLSASTRSNGILNLGFVLYKKVKYFLAVVYPETLSSNFESNPFFCIKTIRIWLLSILVPCFLVLVPFLSFQIYCYYMFCTPQDINLSPAFMNYAVEHALVLPSLGGEKVRLQSHWCHSHYPLAYSYVQNHYWNVGFLNYFRIAQIPNFLLAFPAVFLILSYGIKFFKQHKQLCLKLGVTGKSVTNFEKTHRMSSNMFVYMVHGVALTIFCFFFIHVQVTTRMLFSASPLPYWVGAYIIGEGFIYKEKASTKHVIRDANVNMEKISYLEWKYVNSINDLKDFVTLLKSHLTFNSTLLILYFSSYFLVGTILFSNFLPWT